MKHRLFLFSAAVPVLCLLFPELAALWRKWVILPFACAVSALSCAVPFPVFEPLLVGCAAAAVCRRKLLYRLPAALLAVFLLAWLPVYGCRPAAIASPASARTEALCLDLIAELNASALDFPEAEESLRLAAAAASEWSGVDLHENAVKAARYPEWMDLLDLAGFYSPWTGEALVHPDLPPASVPFTACHELMHRLGIADEGQANIAAWMACRRAGGAAADSAGLWALKYAMASLRQTDAAAWYACTEAMLPHLRGVFASMNGFSAVPPGKAADRLLSFAGHYDALVGWLVNERYSAEN